MPSPVILDKKHSRGTPPQGSTVLPTMKTVYGYSVIHNTMCMCPLLRILKEPNKEQTQTVQPMVKELTVYCDSK